MREVDSSRFPRDLLKQPSRKQLDYFRWYTIKHPLLSNAFDEARGAIADCTPGSLILLFGPTGAGKTTLLKRLCQYFTETLIDTLKNDRGRLPIVLVNLNSPLPGKFDWKDYFKCLLGELKEPLIDKKVNMDRWPKQHPHDVDVDNVLKLERYNYVSACKMRDSTIQSLRHRDPLAVLVDDAQHFSQIGSGRKLLDQLNIIKSMADKSGVTHVLAGTYELLPFRNLNGQLSRRSIDIHFGRYHADNGSEQQEFKNVLYTFQEHLPLNETPDLLSRWDYFYERSIGCVGILKDWLTRSLALALAEQSHTLLPKHLERRSLSVAQCASILREIITGEKELAENVGTLMQLRSALGLEIKAKAEAQNASDSEARDFEQQPTVTPTPRKRRVGTRNPKRDKIGKKVA